MNLVVIALVITAFIYQQAELVEYAGRHASRQDYMRNSTAMQYLLKGWSLKGLFGHIWLHGGFLHIIGNLIFLWLFGNAICSKIGNVFYLPVYVFLGLAAGITHLLFFDTYVLGASGAINGLVGMYLVFFPENEISCFFLLFIRPYWFHVRSFWMILLWFAFDILGALYSSGGVAYLAHIGGFVAGFGLALIMLKTKFVTVERYEKSILQLLRLDN